MSWLVKIYHDAVKIPMSGACGGIVLVVVHQKEISFLQCCLISVCAPLPRLFRDMDWAAIKMLMIPSSTLLMWFWIGHHKPRLDGYDRFD